MSIFELMAKGASIGFAAGGIPGALHSLLINETLRHGWQRSLIIAFTPLMTDAPIILLMVFILDQFPASAITLLQLIGGCYLLWLAYQTWQQRNVELAPSSQRQTIGRAMLVNWLNPAPYIFWGTVNGPLLLEGLDQSLLHGAAFIIAFYGVFISLMIGVVFLFNRVRRLDTQLVRGMIMVSIAVLVIFGLLLIGQAVV